MSLSGLVITVALALLKGLGTSHITMEVANVKMGFPDGSVVKNPPANAGDKGDAGLIPELGRPPQEEMATHSSILAWESHGQRSLASCSPWVAELNMAECAHMHTYS